MLLRALADLCWAPEAPSAVANVAAGALLVRGGALSPSDLAVCGGAGLLYVAGGALDHYVERELDALERPHRPIPRGDLAPAAALAVGLMLMAGGVGLASLAGVAPAAVAGALAACMLLYQGALKGARPGPVARGACRFLTVCLGLSVVGPAPPAAWMWIAPLTMGGYSAAVALLPGEGLEEVGGAGAGERDQVRRAIWAVALVLGGALLALAAASPARRLAGFVWLAPFGVFVAWRARRVFGPVLSDPAPAADAIGRAAGGAVVLMPAIDAAMVAAGGWPAAAACVLSLALPAAALRRRSPDV